MSFKKELANAILLNMPDVHFHTEGFDEAVASIINLVDKEVIQPDQESDHQMSHRQGKGLQRAIIREKP